MASNGVIGRGGSLPWHLPEDLAYFRALTLGHRVIMGRRTWASLERALARRDNVVVTANEQALALAREPLPEQTYLRRAPSLEAARALESLPGIARAPQFVIGGACLYSEALPLCDWLYLTEIDAAFEGDTYFPAWPREAFEEVSRESRRSAEGLAYAFVHYRRIR